MIGKLTGTLSLKNPPDVLVDCHGVGYEVSVPMSTFYNLPALGEPVTLLTHFVVREDAQLLYGFATAPEREAFRQLIRISGVGPRTALSVLSGMSVGELAQAITAQEAGRLVKVPGIGKKTAERLLLELANLELQLFDLAGERADLVFEASDADDQFAVVLPGALRRPVVVVDIGRRLRTIEKLRELDGGGRFGRRHRRDAKKNRAENDGRQLDGKAHNSGHPGKAGRRISYRLNAVSYTHLTLPTKRIV